MTAKAPENIMPSTQLYELKEFTQEDRDYLKDKMMVLEGRQLLYFLYENLSSLKIFKEVQK